MTIRHALGPARLHAMTTLSPHDDASRSNDNARKRKKCFYPTQHPNHYATLLEPNLVHLLLFETYSIRDYLHSFNPESIWSTTTEFEYVSQLVQVSAIIFTNVSFSYRTNRWMGLLQEYSA